MSELPAGWEWATLGEVAESVQNGIFVSRPGETPNGVPILRISSVRAMQLDLSAFRYSELDHESLAEEGRLLKSGDLLFTRYSGSREFVGACARVPDQVTPMTYPDKLIRARTREIDSKYLEAAFSSPAVRSLVEKALRTTAGQVGISGSALKAIRIPIAPIAEQRRIVAALEDHLSRIDAGRSYLTSVQARSRKLEQSLVAAVVAVSHKTDAPARIGDIASVFSGMTPLRSRSDYYETGTVPWITSSQVNQGLITKAERFVSEKALSETSLRIVPAGSILVAMYGEGRTRGKTAELTFPATTNQACAAIVLHEEFQRYRRWIRIFLDSRYDANRRLASGGVQPNLSIGLIKSMSVPLPPAETVDDIVDAVTEKQLELGRLQADVDNEQHVAARLRRSLLTEAFAGHLVPQDPNDEPASVLLDRIRAERASQSKPPPTRRTAAP